jgi:hypothetical protein
VGPRRADRQAALFRRPLRESAQSAELLARLARVAAGLGRDLADRLHQLGLDLALLLDVVERLEEALDRAREIERVAIDDHELFLDPEGVRGAREPVLHGRIVSGA